MIRLFLFVWAIMLVGCTSTEIEKTSSTTTLIPEKTKNFLTKAEIFKELNSKAKGIYMDEPLTDDDKKRMETLVDPKIFFAGQHAARKLHKKKILFKGEAAVDLRSRDTKIKSQDDGKCTAFAGTAALENMMNKDKVIPDLDLSEWDAWSHYGQYSCEAFINAMSKNKICDEKYYPQYGKKSANCSKNAYVKIADQTYIDDDVSKMTAALDKGNVVYIGMSTPNDMVKCKKVISPNTTVSNGGHALLIVGYYKEQGQVVAIIRNSWSESCGDRGYQYMPMSVCSKKNMYCSMWTIDKIEVAANDNPPAVEPTCIRWKTIWYKPWAKKCVEWSNEAV